MINFDLLHPQKIDVVLENDTKTGVLTDGQFSIEDVAITFQLSDAGVDIYCVSQTSLIKHIYLYYPLSITEEDMVFGDAFERGYGDLSWHKANEKQMFWYFFIYNHKQEDLFGFGVKVHPASIVSYKIINQELRIDLNTCSGGQGVFLDSRKILLGSFVFRHYNHLNLFSSMKSFMSLLMGDVKMLQLKESAYGFNNWYYAYGKSSFAQIIDDSLLLKELTKNNQIRPYMVIDDGWSIHPTSGPWIPNDDFKDMKSLADKIKELDLKPGIWIRPLKDVGDVLKDYRHPLNKDLFDITDENVKKHIMNDISKLVDYGYELIKFDFITWDIFNNYGFEMPEDLCQQGWRYSDNHFTNAEIILDLYKIIRKAARGAVLIGCNAIPHFAAGIVEINRIGDDTSGFEWERTRKYGVNSLAFRLIQNNVFYKIDADCVGIMGNKIDWRQNKLWLDILAKSGSPLFVSCNPYLVTGEVKNDLIKSFSINEKQMNVIEPVDWFSEIYPSKWIIDGVETTYDWYLLDNKGDVCI